MRVVSDEMPGSGKRPPITAADASPAEAGRPEPAREPRGAKRKRETRARLLDAAFRLMAARGRDGVTISEITETADVGLGSFYNHFASKEAIHDELIRTRFDLLADGVDEALAGLDDPAEMMAAAVRHVMRHAQREPVWSRFLVGEGLSADLLSRGFGLRLRRDIVRGMDSGRFRASDPLMGAIAAAGIVMAAVSAWLHSRGAGGDDGEGDVLDALPERTAHMLLLALGLPAEEARAIAHQPLARRELRGAAD
jgi:AcrR family transcriptional regulator